MMPVIALGVALGLDNASVVMTLAAAGTTRRVAFPLILAFAAFEALMPLVGLVLGNTAGARIGPWADIAGVAALAGVGAYILLSAFRVGAPEGLPDRTWMVLGLPLSLSADNLMAGVGLGLLGFPAVGAALIFGIVTAAMCLVGQWVGEAASALSPRLAKLTAGAALVAFALLSAAARVG
jgi:manganese efflux pump family protein